MERQRPDSATPAQDWWTAAGFVVVVAAYAGLSGLWTDTSTDWYSALHKPWFQPPGFVFGIIWPLNFLALAVVGVLVSRSHAAIARRALAVFAVSVVLALGWAYLFNQSRELVAAAVSLVLAAVLTWVLLAVLGRASRGYAAGLLVYAAWMTLAATLSATIAAIN